MNQWDYLSRLRENIAKWGIPGTPIPDSRFFRAYCPACAEPMRVSPDDLELDKRTGFYMPEASCSTCRVPVGQGGSENVYDDDPSPWEENNIRHLEDTSWLDEQ
jgi:hypothetical protein